MNQKGAIHLLVPLLLLLGLFVTLYIVTQGSPLKLFSKASDYDKIEFKSSPSDSTTLPTNSNGIPKLQVYIPESSAGVGNTAPFVWVEVTSKNPSQSENTGVGTSNYVLGVNSPTVVTIKAWGDKRRGIVPAITLADGSKKLFTYSVTASSKQNAQTFTYTFPDSQIFTSKPIIQFTNDKVAGDGSSDKEDRNAYIDNITINGVKYETEDTKTYSSGSWSKTNGCGPGYKKQEKLNCNGFFRYDGFTLTTPTPAPTVKPTTIPTPKPTVTPVPTSNPTPSSQPTAAPTVAPTPSQVYTTYFQYAENLVDLDNAPLIPYTPATKAFGYTFKDKTHGVKSLLVQFIDSDGTKHQVPTKYSQIELYYPAAPIPTPFSSPSPTPTLIPSASPGSLVFGKALYLGGQTKIETPHDRALDQDIREKAIRIEAFLTPKYDKPTGNSINGGYIVYSKNEFGLKLEKWPDDRYYLRFWIADKNNNCQKSEYLQDLGMLSGWNYVVVQYHYNPPESNLDIWYHHWAGTIRASKNVNWGVMCEQKTFPPYDIYREIYIGGSEEVNENYKGYIDQLVIAHATGQDGAIPQTPYSYSAGGPVFKHGVWNFDGNLYDPEQTQINSSWNNNGTAIGPVEYVDSNPLNFFQYR